jgi:phosphoribosylformylglycinamidine synthase
MWPCKNQGEDARLYSAVKAASDFAIALGINIPTGKDSLSMTQKYGEEVVYAPGTVIISAAAEISDIRKIVEPVLLNDPDTSLIYIDMSRDDLKTGGSSFAQILNSVGSDVPTVKDPAYFARVFNTVQDIVAAGGILAGHDISAGGLITCLLEMCFSNTEGGMKISLEPFNTDDIVNILFSQNPGIVIQVRNDSGVVNLLKDNDIAYINLGHPVQERKLLVKSRNSETGFDIDGLRKIWFTTSWLLDSKQSGELKAGERFTNYPGHGLRFELNGFPGTLAGAGRDASAAKQPRIKAAIIREKGVNGDREMAYALYLAGFDVKDVHMTDLISGRETLTDTAMIVFVGGFSNSDVLGSAKGWAGAFRYNEKARAALENFYRREDTLSLGVCNGCQLMAELGLIYPGLKNKPRLLHNESNKFESGFVGVRIPENNSVMLGNMAGMELGIWVAHGEGRFSLAGPETEYCITMKYSHHTYPANPNGSDYDVAGLCSSDGRHLVMMPHLERAFFPWQCGYYPRERRMDEVTPWIKAFTNARKWLESPDGRGKK